MSDYIMRIIHCFSNLFRREKDRSQQLRIEPPSRYYTTIPLSRKNAGTFRNPDLRTMKPAYPSPNLRRVPNSCPIIQCPSQISLRRFGSEDDISFRPESFIRSRNSNKSKNGVSKPFDCNFIKEMTGSKIAKKDVSTGELSQAPTYKSSKSSLDFYSVAGDRLETAINSTECCETCEKNFPVKRQLHLRSNPFSHSGYVCKNNHASSKIPVRNLGRYVFRPNLDLTKFPRRHQRGRYTLSAQPLNLNDINDFQANGDTGDNICFRSSDISNWITYRNDTSSKFERVFKTLSKKKHAIGNLIDSTSHSQWMQLAGIMADYDANMFKQFAGGKVVLTFGEYKFLIAQICAIHDLDYWDILRKMATFQDEDLHHEALLTPQ